MGEQGCLSLFGKNLQTHKLLAHHLAAERKIPTEGRGRKVDVWEPPCRESRYADRVCGQGAGAEAEAAIRSERSGRSVPSFEFITVRTFLVLPSQNGTCPVLASPHEATAHTSLCSGRTSSRFQSHLEKSLGRPNREPVHSASTSSGAGLCAAAFGKTFREFRLFLKSLLVFPRLPEPPSVFTGERLSSSE